MKVHFATFANFESFMILNKVKVLNEQIEKFSKKMK